MEAMEKLAHNAKAVGYSEACYEICSLMTEYARVADSNNTPITGEDFVQIASAIVQLSLRKKDGMKI